MARKSVTLQLVEGKDNDLITWWEGLPSGEGQAILKRALRLGIDLLSGLGGGGNTADSPAPDTPPQAAASRETDSRFAADIADLLRGFVEVAATQNKTLEQQLEVMNKLLTSGIKVAGDEDEAKPIKPQYDPMADIQAGLADMEAMNPTREVRRHEYTEEEDRAWAEQRRAIDEEAKRREEEEKQRDLELAGAGQSAPLAVRKNGRGRH